MSLSPEPGPSSIPSFVYTSDVDASSYASLFSKQSDMPDFFTSLSPEQSSFQASVASMASQAATMRSSSQLSGEPTLSRSTRLSQTASPASSAGVSSVSPSAVSASETDAAASETSHRSGSTTSTPSIATNAANSATSNLQKEEGSMSSPGMQAAVAVPVVVVMLLAAILLFFCMRRRRKRAAQNARDEVEKAPVAGVKQKWTRHLRIFSFDTELLMGGRYSSTNSIRSRQTGSLRSGNRSQHSDSPSLHSVEEVAPPYRDAISTGPAPNIAAVMAGGAAGAGVNRSASSATAPPPYGATAGRLTKPVSAASSIRDPFADGQSPISPTDGSPFNDPPGTTPTISRTSSLFRSDKDDQSSVGDAASIRQATLARNASVMSGGRVIDNVSRSSQ